MPRTAKPEEHAEKRGRILEAAQHLVFTRGYEHMAIRDILSRLDISSGAFHHYFDSRASLLTALTEHIQGTTEALILPVVHAPHLSALEKLQGYFDVLDRLRLAQKAVVVDLLRAWYLDGNAVVRHRVQEAVFARRTPLLGHLIRQGLVEGVFTTAFPDQAGELVQSLLHGMETAQAKQLLGLGDTPEAHLVTEEIVTTHAAYMDAIERVLGAPSHSLRRVERAAVQVWITALQEGGERPERH